MSRSAGGESEELKLSSYIKGYGVLFRAQAKILPELQKMNTPP